MTSSRRGVRVYLNVYDLAEGPVAETLYSIGCGLHHSGVEVLGTEYSFASGAGIFTAPPQTAPGAKFRTQIELGAMEGGLAELRQAIADLEPDFGPSDYHLLVKNCNHFSQALCWRLLRQSIPPHINRLSDMGRCCRCLLPRQMLEHAPVGDTTPGADSKVDTFGGAGQRLGAGSQHTETKGLLQSVWTSSSSSSGDDLQDRREKARRAALARLEQSSKQS